MDEKCKLEDLPNETLDNIAIFMPVTDLLSLVLVSRRFSVIAKTQLYHSLLCSACTMPYRSKFWSYNNGLDQAWPVGPIQDVPIVSHTRVVHGTDLLLQTLRNGPSGRNDELCSMIKCLSISNLRSPYVRFRGTERGSSKEFISLLASSLQSLLLDGYGPASNVLSLIQTYMPTVTTLILEHLAINSGLAQDNTPPIMIENLRKLSFFPRLHTLSLVGVGRFDHTQFDRMFKYAPSCDL